MRVPPRRQRLELLGPLLPALVVVVARVRGRARGGPRLRQLPPMLVAPHETRRTRRRPGARAGRRGSRHVSGPVPTPLVAAVRHPLPDAGRLDRNARVRVRRVHVRLAVAAALRLLEDLVEHELRRAAHRVQHAARRRQTRPARFAARRHHVRRRGGRRGARRRRGRRDGRRRRRPVVGDGRRERRRARTAYAETDVRVRGERSGRFQRLFDALLFLHVTRFARLLYQVQTEVPWRRRRPGGR